MKPTRKINGTQNSPARTGMGQSNTSKYPVMEVTPSGGGAKLTLETFEFVDPLFSVWSPSSGGQLSLRVDGGPAVVLPIEASSGAITGPLGTGMTEVIVTKPVPQSIKGAVGSKNVVAMPGKVEGAVPPSQFGSNGGGNESGDNGGNGGGGGGSGGGGFPPGGSTGTQQSQIISGVPNSALLIAAGTLATATVVAAAS